MEIHHTKPHSDNKYGRIVTIRVIDGDIHYWKIPFIDPQVATDKRKDKKSIRLPKGQLSALEQLAIERGGTVRDIKHGT